ncbi:MAG: 5-oxoprolinase subunit PxpA [Rhodovarius sp.]|nr:5-oxoprolinase subunit PxpA [Rhodovarius sp.]MCX7932631.1 5-oxoprolinase subunit PxpA [Rhodovarius sp.]MDW8314556.1 5-oxoprolinase subunit PxpA [Rhodovarius sp.]
MRAIAINCDLGESFGTWRKGDDAAIMPLIDSANIACGFHAGDPSVMAETVALAARHGVSIGAHPGFPDLQGFGRRPMRLSAREIEAIIAYQVGALMGVAALHGARVTHVKTHGALHNMAVVDEEMARAICRAIRAVDPGLIHVGLAGSALQRASEEAGLPFAVEGYIDRMYDEDGKLTARSNPDAVHHDPARAAAQAVAMARDGVIITRQGARLPVRVDTLCVHGDEPTAVAVARAARQALKEAGITLRPLPQLRSGA